MNRYILNHGFYGCESGCCGYYLRNEDDVHENFTFSHPWTDDGYDTTDEGLTEFARKEFNLAEDDEIAIGSSRGCAW